MTGFLGKTEKRVDVIRQTAIQRRGGRGAVEPAVEDEEEASTLAE